MLVTAGFHCGDNLMRESPHSISYSNTSFYSFKYLYCFSISNTEKNVVDTNNVVFFPQFFEKQEKVQVNLLNSNDVMRIFTFKYL